MTELLRHHQVDDVVAFGEGGVRTAADLRRDVSAIAAALPIATPGSHVLLVVSRDRYEFAAALLGAWSAGHAVALPPNHRAGTIGALLQRDDIAALLHDTQAGGHLRVSEVLTTVAALEPRPIRVPDHAATVFTSGSTGNSEPCTKTRDQLLGEVAVLAELFEMRPGERTVATVPPAHLYGLLFGVLLPLHTGGAFLRETPLQPEAIAARLAEHRAHTLVGVPVHLRAAQVLAAGALGSVHRVFSSTAPLPEDTAQHFTARHDRSITEIFGSTETGGIAWRHRSEGDDWRPLPGVRIDVDAEGRLRVDSPFLHPDDPRPLPTADLAEPGQGGAFRHLGRIDGVVKIGGVRVSLPAMQRCLLAQDGVDDAEVVAVPASNRGVRLLAAVATRTRTEDELRASLADQFHPSTLPRRIWIGPTLPREPSGKFPRERMLAQFGLAPDGTPFVRELELGAPTEGGTVEVTIPERYAWFLGHFDGYPILAGAVQLLELVLPVVERMRPHFGPVRELKRLKFTGRIVPGDRITITVRFSDDDRGCDFEIAKGTTRCSAGRLTFS